LVKLLKGRPRKKDVKRYAKNGRITRASAADDARQTVIDARMRHYRVSRSAAKEQNVGSPLGLLVRWGHITPLQYDSGNKFAEHIRDYLPLLPAPRDTPKCVEASLTGPMGVVHQLDDPRRDEREVKITKRARELITAIGVLDDAHLGSPRSHYSVVWDVCVAEKYEPKSIYELGLLREGLNAVHRVLERWRG
jgi:hypothetical protein